MSTLFLQIQTGVDAVLAEEPTEKTMTILELMTSGGSEELLWLFQCSTCSCLYFLGAIRCYNRQNGGPNFMNNIKDMVLDGKLDAAAHYARKKTRLSHD